MPIPCGVAVMVFKLIDKTEWLLFGKRKGAHGEGQ